MDELKKLLGKAAPWLAAASAGPAGLAMMAAKTIAGALGQPDDASPQDLAVALAGAKPEQLAAIRQAEMEFKARMAALGYTNIEKLEQIAAADRHSARRANVDGGTHERVFWLTCLIFVVVIGVEAAVLFLGIPPGVDGQMVGRILGTLDAALLAALYYTYGSSAGSARKDAARTVQG